jgi:hypothetical protein
LFDGKEVWVQDNSRQGMVIMGEYRPRFQEIQFPDDLRSRVQVFQKGRPGRGYNQVQPGEVLSTGNYTISLESCEQVNPCWLAWKEGTIVRIAQVIREQSQYEHLPILGDALEEAGCDNEEVLGHCRQPGKHADRCWVLEWIFGKEAERAATQW